MAICTTVTNTIQTTHTHASFWIMFLKYVITCQYITIFSFFSSAWWVPPLRHSFNRSYIQLPKTNIQNQLYIVMSRRTANTTVATPKYCCLFCFQKHGTIQQTWGGFVVKQVARRSTKYVHKCMGLTRHLRQSNECSAYYSSNGLTWNRHINYKSSMLSSGPTIHQQVHWPSAFLVSFHCRECTTRLHLHFFKPTVSTNPKSCSKHATSSHR